jgi:hypothetical protein
MTEAKNIEISTDESNIKFKEKNFTREEKVNTLKNGTMSIHSRLFEDPYFEDPITFLVGVYLENETYKSFNLLSADHVASILYNFHPNPKQRKRVRETIEKMIADGVIICEKDYGNGNYFVNLVNWVGKKYHEKTEDKCKDEEEKEVVKPKLKYEAEDYLPQQNPWDENKDDWGYQGTDEPVAENEAVTEQQDEEKKKKSDNMITILNDEYPGYYENIPAYTFLTCVSDNAKITCKAMRLKVLAYIRKRMYRWRKQNGVRPPWYEHVAMFSQQVASNVLNTSETTLKNHIKWFEENKLIVVARATVKYNKQKGYDDRPSIERAPNVYSFKDDISYIYMYIDQPQLKDQNYKVGGQGKIKLTAK